MKSTLLPFLCGLGVLIPHGVLFGDTEESGNLALGASYRVTPANGLARGATPGILTDGAFSGDPIWKQETAAALLYASRPVSITVDLKKRQPISGVAISSAAGEAISGKDIFVWPGRIDIYVSDDNQSFFPVGELTSLHDRENEPLPPFGAYARRKISTRSLQTHGRYVKLLISYSRPIYIDEIEVYRGDERSMKQVRPAPAFANDKEMLEAFQPVAINPNPRAENPEKEAKEAAKLTDLHRFVIQRRYRQDLAELKQRASLLPNGAGEPIVNRLKELGRQVETSAPVVNAVNTLPFGELGEKILAEAAAIWRAQGLEGLTVWQTPLWDHLPWMQQPQKGSAVMETELLRGETRSLSLNLTNPDAETKTVTLTAKGIAPENLEVHFVEWTETAWRLAVATALPVATSREGQYEISLPPGMTRQVWLTVRGPKEDVNGGLLIAESGKTPVEVPLRVKVYPFDFPEQPALHSSGFECASDSRLRRRYGVFRENLPGFVKLLQSKSIDAPWATRNEFGFGRFNTQHEYAAPEDQPDTASFREWTTELWPNAYRYHIALTVKDKSHNAVIDRCDASTDPEGFQKRVNRWLSFWKDEALRHNIDPSKIYLKLIDEPGYNAAAPYVDDEAIRVWAEAIRKSGTGFKVFINPIYEEPWNASRAMLEAGDVICLKYSHVLRFGERYLDFYRSLGKEISIYECYGAPGHLYDPYTYYRLQAWQAWALGAKTQFFWNYAETAPAHGFPDSWNTGLNQWTYTPLFLTPTSTVSSKQMEAIREGINDYQILHLLKTALEAAEQQGVPASDLADARKLLESAAGSVLGNGVLDEPRWAWPRQLDRTGADAVRQQLMHALDQVAKFVKTP